MKAQATCRRAEAMADRATLLLSMLLFTGNILAQAFYIVHDHCHISGELKNIFSSFQFVVPNLIGNRGERFGLFPIPEKDGMGGEGGLPSASGCFAALSTTESAQAAVISTGKTDSSLRSE